MCVCSDYFFFAMLTLMLYFSVSNMNSVVGTFNSMLENKIFVILEEAFTNNDKATASAIKALITEDWLNCTRKFQETKVSANFLNFFIISNADHVVPAEGSARRYTLFETGQMYKGNQEYFARLQDALHDPTVVCSFAHALFSRNISNFGRGQNFPITELLADQQKHTMTTEEYWWYEVLCTGQHVAPEECSDDYMIRDPNEPWVRMVTEKDLFEKCNSDLGRNAPTKKIFVLKMKQMTLCGEFVRRQVHMFQTVGGVRRSNRQKVNFFSLPSLEECRANLKARFNNLNFPVDMDVNNESTMDFKRRKLEDSLLNMPASEVVRALSLDKLKSVVLEGIKHAKDNNLDTSAFRELL